MILYLSRGLKSVSVRAHDFSDEHEWCRRLKEKEIDAMGVVFGEDLHGHFAHTAVPCDGVVIIHTCAQRVRYELIDACRAQTRTPGGVPVLFLGRTGIDHSRTMIGVKHEDFSFLSFETESEAFAHLLAFCVTLSR